MRVGSAGSLRVAWLAALVALPVLAVPVPAPAQTQSWPQRPVRFVLPFGAGSATDVAARLMTDKLQAIWGQPVVIEAQGVELKRFYLFPCWGFSGVPPRPTQVRY